MSNEQLAKTFTTLPLMAQIGQICTDKAEAAKRIFEAGFALA
jgi:hypothetical protein